jgi:hypothetical protein
VHYNNAFSRIVSNFANAINGMEKEREEEEEEEEEEEPK